MSTQSLMPTKQSSITVREFMNLWVGDIDMLIYQEPIPRLDGCHQPVLRQAGTLDILAQSNQNYLNFAVTNAQIDNGTIIIMCKANQEQEDKIIRAYRSQRRNNL